MSESEQPHSLQLTYQGKELGKPLTKIYKQGAEFPPDQLFIVPAEMLGKCQVLIAAGTTTGLVREDNKDAYHVGRIRSRDATMGAQFIVPVVADGVGVAHTAERASQSITRGIAYSDTRTYSFGSRLYDLLSNPANSSFSLIEIIREAVFLADRDIQAMNKFYNNTTATTFTGLVLKQNTQNADELSAAFIQIGDSPAYHWNRERGLVHLTHDYHVETLSDEQIRMYFSYHLQTGSPEEIEAFRTKHASKLAWRLDGSNNFPIDIRYKLLHKGDIVLISTDGLKNSRVTDPRIGELINSEAQKQTMRLDNIVVNLLAESLKNGGVDNATAIVIAIR